MLVNKDYSDSELMAMMATDQQGAFAAIYSRYASSLMRFACRKIGNREESEELIQDVFESLWSRRRNLDHVTALRSYLFTMVRYKIVDYIRHSQVKKKFEAHFLLFEEVYDNLTDRTSDAGEIQALIEKSISQLPARCQAAFRLRLDDDMPYKEIALRMNISIKTVEKHISAALLHLRRAVHKPSFPRP